MSLLTGYLASAGQPDIFSSGPDGERRVYDEFVAADGRPRPGWQSLLDSPDDLRVARREVARLLQDDAVTYTPAPPGGAGADAGLAAPTPWRLDPMPWVVDAWEWAALEIGLVQRAELLNAILADLYGDRRLLANRLLPPEVVLGHDEYLRAAIGIDQVAASQLLLTATDLGRDAEGDWRVLADRTQAPSGAGYAMQNRRVISRALPALYQRAHLHRLTPFFQSMRTALVDAAPSQVENPRVVVLTPGTHAETAFDQAFVASLLGFPLVEGNDLTVRDGRVYLCGLDREEQVDVILRRVDSAWSDPLELRPDSKLGVSGLLECVRQGTVTVANPLGSGVLENPGLAPFLPAICEALLGEPLRLPSVETFWCGDDSDRSHVVANLDHFVIRPIAAAQGPSLVGANLTQGQQAELITRISARPHAFVGQRRLPLSSAPSAEDDHLVPRPVSLRSFAVRRGTSYATMMGGLGTVDEIESRPGGAETGAAAMAKDVWVVASAGEPAPVSVVLPEGAGMPAGQASAAMVPRVLNDLFWFGRYAERAEDLLRLLLAVRQVAAETDDDRTSGGPLDSLTKAVTHVSSAYPGFLVQGTELLPELRAMILNRRRAGTVAQSVAALTNAAQGVRDQLSEDVWMVLAGVDRALLALTHRPDDRGAQLFDTSERVLSGLLALTGITSENMVRDPGWYLLDSGRGIERSLQVLSLLRFTICRPHAESADQMIIEAALSAAESIVTHRRRYRGRTRQDAVMELLVTDAQNPRSVAYQVTRLAGNLRSLPDASETSRSLRIVGDISTTLAESQRFESVNDLLGDLQDQFRSLAGAIEDQYLEQPPQPQPLWRSLGAIG